MDSLFESNGLIPSATAGVFKTFIYHQKEGEIYFNPLYQRDYVWKDNEAQYLLAQIFKNRPIGYLAVVFNKHDDPSKYLEVVDGKQRLTTLLMFVNNQFPFKKKDGTELYFKEMSKSDQIKFVGIKLPYYELTSSDFSVVTDRQKVEYFYSSNFAGVPQSQEHRGKIERLLKELN